jgi:ApaG protein
MIDVSRTLVKTLLKQVTKQQRSHKRLRTPVLVEYWGNGGKVPARTATDRILSSFPTLVHSPGLENLITEHIQPYISAENIATNAAEGNTNDFDLLRNVLRSIIRSRNTPPDKNTLDRWLAEGFEVHRILHQMHDLWLGSSITKTKDLYIDVTSTYHSELSESSGTNVFAYAIYIENQSSTNTLQVLGRHWKTFSHKHPNSIQEVKQLEQGLVGYQPKLEPGQGFYYVSGTDLDSYSGEMSGQLSIREYLNHDEEEPVVGGVHIPGENNWLAEIEPFQLLSPNPDND